MELEYEETQQEVAQRRRALGIGKAISDVAVVKFDKPRKLDFRTTNIILMERQLGKKAWQIIQDFRMGGWSQEDLMGIVWAGLKKDNPDITPFDVNAIWDATPVHDRQKAIRDVTYAVVRALGADVTEDGEVFSEDKKKEK